MIKSFSSNVLHLFLRHTATADEKNDKRYLSIWAYVEMANLPFPWHLRLQIQPRRALGKIQEVKEGVLPSLLLLLQSMALHLLPISDEPVLCFSLRSWAGSNCLLFKAVVRRKQKSLLICRRFKLHAFILAKLNFHLISQWSWKAKNICPSP